MEGIYMKLMRALPVSMISMLIGVLVFSVSVWPARSEPKTWIVDDDGPADFRTIQEAVETADDGDTVFVKIGTYYEHVNVTRSLTMFGERRETTVIDGGSTGGSVVRVLVDNTTIQGFTIQNAGVLNDGVWLDNRANCTISGNNITNNNRGIDLYECQNCVVSDNVVTNNPNPLFSSFIDPHGICMQSCRSCVVQRNNVTDNWSGIFVGMDCESCIITDNVADSNRVHGVYLYYCENCTMKGNKIANSSSSFGVDGWQFKHVMHNIDASNTINGKPIYYWVNQHHRRIPDDASYVEIVNSTDITIENLNLTKNEIGLRLLYTNDSTIRDVNASGNWEEGIDLSFSNNCIIIGNNVSDNAYGIMLALSDNCTLTGNNVRNNPNGGFWIDRSDDCKVTENVVEDVHRYAVFLSECSNSTFYHNSFINNWYQVSIGGKSFNDTWDNGCEGNYWSDYCGNDTGQDGVGDTDLPYATVDYYPLMSPYMPGDVNHDARVNIVDISIIARAFGTQSEDTNWNPHADLDGNGKINIIDISKAAKEFGNQWER
jgi:parallel beta-helix repeat protein